MSTTVTYKGETLTTANNQTRTLETAGKYMEDDVTIVDVTSSATLQSKTATYTPTESQQTETITADSGYNGLSSVDVTVNAVSSTYVGSGITRRSSSDLTASGATVTVPAGYYASSASESVTTMTLPTAASSSRTYTNRANINRSTSTQYLNISQGYTGISASYTIPGTPNGTAGTPTATKGTVSNHSVSVTPSVTNTTGYITGSTKTGTAVTVSASELVSGSQTITENDTYDVTNLASVEVNVSGGSTDMVTINLGAASASFIAVPDSAQIGSTAMGFPYVTLPTDAIFVISSSVEAATASNCTYGLISSKLRPTTDYYWVKSGTQDGNVEFGGQQ